MTKTTQNTASKKAPTQKTTATAKKPTTTASAQKTPSKKTVPATADSIMKFLESDSKNVKKDHKELAKGQMNLTGLVSECFNRMAKNLENHNKSMINVKDEIEGKMTERFDRLEEKVDEICEVENPKIVTGGLLGLAAIVTIAVIIAVAFGVIADGATTTQAFLCSSSFGLGAGAAVLGVGVAVRLWQISRR